MAGSEQQEERGNKRELWQAWVRWEAWKVLRPRYTRRNNLHICIIVNNKKKRKSERKREEKEKKKNKKRNKNKEKRYNIASR